MFCYQCEQTKQGKGCDQIGICGKDETTAALQDLLIHAVKGISMYAHRAHQMGAADPEVDAFVVEGLFATLTNVNFDATRLQTLISQASSLRDQAKRCYEEACRKSGIASETLGGPANWNPESTIDSLYEQRGDALITERMLTAGSEVANLQEMILYGLKGVAAYAEHAKRLGGADPAAYATIHEILDFLTWPSPTAEQLLTMTLRTGELNYRVMELLDRVNTDTFGHPEPTQVRVSPRKDKAILVSGHDLCDLQMLLEQTKGLGIQVYTHGEMLPAHAYPTLKTYEHLAGNYGGAWMDQGREFAEFPGAILMTSNCIQRPKDGYKSRIFTTGPVAWPGVQHISDGDFAPVIASALRAPGYEQDGPDETITVGFGRNAVLSVAGKVIEAVKAGAIRHFFLIGGCDGAKAGRSYYTELAKAVPDD
jgi:hydroxylamine reductase